MGELSEGSRLRTAFGRELRVMKELGRGGQGIVYKVACGNEQKALKWYFEDRIYDPVKFVRNLKNNILAGPPTPDFIWPQDFVETANGELGYVMDLRPQGYFEAGDLLIDPEGHKFTFKRAVDACLGMVTAFRVIHDAGYRYQDINDGNFFIDPATGKILICDNDNVAAEGMDTGMLGHPDFMAPEIVLRKSMPTIRTDLHSLAVLIFLLLVGAHPLVGVRGARRDAEANLMLFGTNPLFIFDPNNRSNAPLRGEDGKSGAECVWECLPDHMREVFCAAFSAEALRNPNRRPTENRWLGELARFRSEIVVCRCGNEVFLQGTMPRRCERCGAVAGARLRVELSDGTRSRPLVPVVADARVYKCQVFAGCGATEAVDPLVWMLPSKGGDPGRVGIRNMSGVHMDASFGGRTQRIVPGAVVSAAEGLVLRVPGMRQREFLRVSRNVK